MNRYAASIIQLPVESVWVRCGWTILSVTLVGITCLWLANPLSTGRMFIPLLFGGLPAACCFCAALYCSANQTRTDAPPVVRWGERTTVRQAVAGLLLLALVTAALAFVCYRRDRVQQAHVRAEQARCVREAEAAVVPFLQDSNNLHPYPNRPGEQPPDFGEFIELQGEGYILPVWNIQGYNYLTARRIARFTNGDLPVTIYVEEGARTKPFSREVTVRYSSWGTGVSEGSFRQTVWIHVAHPDLE